MVDEQIIRLTAMLGAAGGVGFGVGVALSARRNVTDTAAQKCHAQYLSMPVFFIWIALSVLLSWLAAPQDTIFKVIYTASSSILKEYNFSSAWLVSYIIMAFAM